MRSIWVLTIVLAFAAGSITTGTMVSAAPPADNPGKPFDAILEKFDEVLAAIAGIDQSDLTMIKDDVVDIKTETDKIPMLKDDVGDIKTETDKIPMLKDDVGDIKTTVNNIDKSFSKIIDKRVVTSLSSNDKIQCTSDRDYLLHVFLKLNPGASYQLAVPGILVGLNANMGLIQSYTVGAVAGNTITVDTTASPAFILGSIVLQTTSDATPSCVDVP